MTNISGRTYLMNDLTLKNKLKFMNYFIENEFEAYNYELNDFGDSKIILEDEYMDDRGCALRYKTEDIVFGSLVGSDYLNYLIDGDNENSKIILDVADSFSNILKEIKFSYIDSEGDAPDDLDDEVESILIKTLFKYNYFGREYIEKYGKQFFEEFPAEKVNFLNENVVRLDLVEDLFDTVSDETKEKVESYLNEFGIYDVYFYDYKEHMF